MAKETIVWNNFYRNIQKNWINTEKHCCMEKVTTGGLINLSHYVSETMEG